METHRKPPCQALVPLVLFGYLFLSIFSPMHMGHMTDMSMAMIDCPYFPFQSTGGDSLSDHLSAWSSFVLIIVSAIFILLIGVAAKFDRLDLPILSANYGLLDGDSPPPEPPMEELFSSGLLHSRIP